MRWLLPPLFLLALMGLQWVLWLGDGGRMEVRELRETIRLQHQENENLRARNRALEAEVENLREGTEAVEERARRDLGMIREDEIFFFLIRPERGLEAGVVGGE